MSTCITRTIQLWTDASRTKQTSAASRADVSTYSGQEDSLHGSGTVTCVTSLTCVTSGLLEGKTFGTCRNLFFLPLDLFAVSVGPYEDAAAQPSRPNAPVCRQGRVS